MSKQPNRSLGGALFLLLLAVLLAIGERNAHAQDLLVLSNISVATSVAPGDSDEESPGSPVVGFDGTNYLVVHREIVTGSWRVKGTTISPSGIVLNQFDISDQIEGRFPALGFNGTNYLLTFNHGSYVHGLFIDPSGGVIGNNAGFVISPITSEATSYKPALAFDGTNFLVVWQEFVFAEGWHRIHGIRVTADGTALGAEFLINSFSNSQVTPQVAFDGQNYLVVWCRETFNASFTMQSDIRGARVSPEGTVLDPASFEISTAPNIQESPAIAFNGTNYLVVWLDQRSYPDDWYNRHIYGARVSTNGVLMDCPAASGGIPVNTTHLEGKRDPRVCFDGKDFFITWWVEDYDSGSFATRISPTGILLDGPAVTSGMNLRAPACSACKIAHAPAISNGRSVLVPWLLNSEVGGTFKEIHANIVVSKTRIAKPRINNVERMAATGGLRISFDTWNGVPYQVQQSSNLTVWQDVGGAIPGTGGAVDTELGQPTSPSRSFRVKVAIP